MTRRLLLDGAFRAIARHGYADTSVDVICTEAGFTRGAFYSNFVSKDELGLALYRLRAERVLETLRTASLTAEREPDIAGTLLAAMTDTDEYLFKTGFELAALRDSALLLEVRQVDAQVVAGVAAVVVRVAEAQHRRLQADPVLPARALVALFRGIAAESLLTGDKPASGNEALGLVLAVVSVYSGPSPVPSAPAPTGEKQGDSGDAGPQIERNVEIRWPMA